MSMVFYEPGDTVYYPHWQQPSTHTLHVEDRNIIKHMSGKIFSQYLFDNLLDVLVEDMKENVRDDLDNVICVWGPEGSGKSNLAYWVAKKYDPNFDIEKSYTYSFDDLLTKIHDCDDADEGSVFWMDEATNISNNRDWMQKDNKAFITMLEMFRSRKWCLILCIPDFYRLDIYLREHRVRYALHAEVMSWEHSTTRSRGYFQLTKMENKSSTGYRKEIKVGYGRFPRIPEDEVAIYNRIKNQTQDSKLHEMYDLKNKKNRTEQITALNKRLILRMHEAEGLSYQEIADFTGLKEGTVKMYCSDARKERE